MISILLTILKLLGIFLLSLLGILVLLLLLALFVPVRYLAAAWRESESGQAFTLRVKVTWLLHFLNVHFSYPEEAYVKVRILCFTIFRSDKEKPKKKASPEEKPEKSDQKQPDQEPDKIQPEEIQSEEIQSEETQSEEGQSKKEPERKEEPDQEEGGNDPGFEQEEKPSGREFFRKLFSILKNLRYTITQICDKIKKIVKNIKYYIGIINSDQFKKSFQLCGTQAGALLRHIRPQKVKGHLLIGTGDPASTGQVLAVYGMLYPFLGKQIAVTADFEQRIVEGELSIKGRITLFRLVRCAWVVYFNKDLRRLIKMLKREAK